MAKDSFFKEKSDPSVFFTKKPTQRVVKSAFFRNKTSADK